MEYKKKSKLGGIMEGFLTKKIKTFEDKKQILQMQDSVSFVIHTIQDSLTIIGEQYRPTTGVRLINSFGGYIDAGESPEEALKRECMEETNIDSSKGTFEFLHKSKFISPGYTTERSTIAILHLDTTIDKLDLKCNDKKEGITFKTYTKEELNEIEFEGLKSEVLRRHLIK